MWSKRHSCRNPNFMLRLMETGRTKEEAAKELARIIGLCALEGRRYLQYVASRRCVPWRTGRRQRRFFRNPDRMRSNRLWKQLMLGSYLTDQVEWRQQVGCNHKTFEYICKKIMPHMKKPRAGDRYIPPKKKILSVLNLLRFGKQQRDTAFQLGVGRNTLGSWVKEVINALVAVAADFIQLPTSDEELQAIADGFRRFKRSRLTNVVGAIDGIHIRIASRDLSDRNRKGFDSFLCQVMCDHTFYIRSVCAGGCGCYSDKTMYDKSGIQKWIDYISNKNVLDIGGVPVGYYILGDGIYGIRPGLIPPFIDRDAPWTPAMAKWNFWHSSCRMVIEQTFGILKARWCILNNLATSRYTKSVKYADIFVACCVLHNICLLHSDVWAREDELPPGHHDDYENTENSGCMPAAGCADATALGKAQRRALVWAAWRAHMDHADDDSDSDSDND